MATKQAKKSPSKKSKKTSAKRAPLPKRPRKPAVVFWAAPGAAKPDGGTLNVRFSVKLMRGVTLTCVLDYVPDANDWGTTPDASLTLVTHRAVQSQRALLQELVAEAPITLVNKTALRAAIKQWWKTFVPPVAPDAPASEAEEPDVEGDAPEVLEASNGPGITGHPHLTSTDIPMLRSEAQEGTFAGALARRRLRELGEGDWLKAQGFSEPEAEAEAEAVDPSAPQDTDGPASDPKTPDDDDDGDEASATS